MFNKNCTFRIIGLLLTLILLIGCSSPQDSKPTSLTTIVPPPVLTPTSTSISPTQTMVSPNTTPTDLPPQQIQIEVTRDIPYTSQLKLDVYKPVKPGPWPVVVALHGGGQNKELFNVFSKRIAELGAVVFTPSWRGSEPQGDQITRELIVGGWEDAACSIRFARANGSAYGGDPGRIVVVGYSGGGTSGAVMALAGDDFDGDCLVNEGSAFPDAFVGVDGAYDLIKCCIPESIYTKASPEVWELIVPYTYIDRRPIRSETEFHLIVGGTAELAEMAETFYKELTATGYETTLTQFPALDHGQIVSLPLPELFGIVKNALNP